LKKIEAGEAHFVVSHWFLSPVARRMASHIGAGVARQHQKQSDHAVCAQRHDQIKKKKKKKKKTHRL
jgi:hypothetical protein